MIDHFVKERDRARIPQNYQWNLADVYPDRDAWRVAKETLVSGFPEINQFRGKLAESAQTLCRCLVTLSRIEKEQTRLMCYASMSSDLDTRDAVAMAMEQEMGQIGTDFAAHASFIDPEILKIGQRQIEAFIVQEPALETFRHLLDDILRRQEHTGTETEEKIIADAGLMSDTPGSIYSVFSNADFPFPEVTLADGSTVRLDAPAFSLHRRSPVREDRKKVFTAYLGKMYEFRRTYGAQLYAEVRKNMFFSRARHYRSALERSLDGSNIPLSVYTNLVNGVRENLGTLHRYLRIRKKLQGLEQLHYYDLYAPLVKQLDQDYQFDEAAGHVLASLEPLGQEYVEVVRNAFRNRWIDVYHNEGKRSGAYSNGSVYDVHPYILLNYNGKYDDVSTLAHELGHTMHSHLSNRAQPYHLSRYSIFIAEVASTFNEALLLDYMLKTVSDDVLRLSLLGNYLDGARATVFRQVQFAEYEMRIHEAAEKGEALTGDLLSSMYHRIAKEYYGHDAGICIVDDEIRAEWSYIPHFYYNFYVYQYATSFTASSALAERVLVGDGEATAAYLSLLRSGAADYPVELLKKAGVDMTTQEPLRATLQRMNRVMDEMEELASRIPSNAG
jgi:oligoendopeptidase F